MRFLHLSDLHLGKRVCEFSMLDDQRYILEQVLSLLDTRPVDGVLLAGAVFRLPGLVLLPLRREAGAVASNAFGCAGYGSGRRKTPGRRTLCRGVVE